MIATLFYFPFFIHALNMPIPPLHKGASITLNNLLQLSSNFTITLVWCPARVGIQENELVDMEARDATTVGKLLDLPVSLSALRRQINAVCKSLITQTPALTTSNTWGAHMTPSGQGRRRRPFQSGRNGYHPALSQPHSPLLLPTQYKRCRKPSPFLMQSTWDHQTFLTTL